MYEQGYIIAPGREAGARRGPRPRARLQLRDDPRALLLRLRRAGADRRLRRQHRAPGRPRGLHHDQPAASRRSPSRPSRTASRRSAGPPAPSCRPTSRPATSSPWPPRATSRPRSSTSPPRATASRAPSFKPFVLADGDPRGDRPRHAPTTAAPARSASAWAQYAAPWIVNNSSEASQRHAQPAPPPRPTRPTPSTPSSASTSGRRTSRTWRKDLGITLAARRRPGGDDRRPRRRRLAARDVERLRDLRQRRRPQPGRPRSPGSSSPTARPTSPTRRRRQPGAHRRRGLRGHRVLETVVDSGTGDRRELSAAPHRRQDRARPTRTPTPGSSATRRTSRRRSGSATRTRGPRSAPPPSAVPTRRRSGTTSCRRPTRSAPPSTSPTEMPDLSAFYGEHAVSAPSAEPTTTYPTVRRRRRLDRRRRSERGRRRRQRRQLRARTPGPATRSGSTSDRLSSS